MRNEYRHLLLLFCVAVLTSCLGGCSGYVMRGKVVAGDFSTMAFVDADDPRLADPGLIGAEIRVYRDPRSPGISLSGRGLTDANGRLNIPIDAFGAGFLVEQFRIECRRAGHQEAILEIPLPAASKGQELLIILTHGQSTPSSTNDDLMEQYRRFR